ncbi:M56 family metallopeptidase [Aurantiacibacter poecillastricola]|uniref:M56 family metallopeptidase n=1 Tax=Aurantiacibacter poecillastricola TaxID=3064385 RepID=UPI00273DDF23|nr:M56 family metallopeptidase [Aurantiacibacter sp. 219JJ12-13]MDP5261837.1 M56 family metallopeptidase [Aurantiacibacter sp. 219JJ12-13]
MTGLAQTGWTAWMIDTFVYTGLLVALVLLLRRPVSRWCGPQVAYALWALPFLRFIMPPIVLPAWMAPEPEVAAASGAEPLMVLISDPAPASAAQAATPAVGFAAGDLLWPLWIGGALIFLGWRVRNYIQMRRDLLEKAIPVGEAGKVRLVETPAVTGPVAFGIADKVVALPPAFMAHYDIKARDLAIAHELAHHRGYDLVANIAAQPLLALHWFNPLAWWGWRAMRRDQEAACDARVVAGRAQSERAAYAEVIAGFATGDDLALAAPMACPVLGEKSIIHRLRSLTMSEVSTGRRRLGIAAITTTALALPLTASITYARGEMPSPPDAPLPPEAPLAPEPPMPPEAPYVDDEDMHVLEHFDEETGERRVIRYQSSDGWSPETEAEVEAYVEQIELQMEDREQEIEAIVERAHDQAERAVAMSERARERAEHARERAAHARERAAHNRALAARAPQVELSCDGVGASGIVSRELSDGRTAMVICEEAISQSARLGMEGAIVGMRAAMQQIASNPRIPRAEREEAIRELEAAIEEVRRESRAMGRTQASASSSAEAIAISWRGRMVSPVQVAPPTPPQPPAVHISANFAPTVVRPDAECEDNTRRSALLA